MTAKLTANESGLAAFEVELVRGDGRHLTRDWRTFGVANRALEGKLPRTISWKPSKTKLRVGERYAFYVSMRFAACKTGKDALTWYSPQPNSLTRLASPNRKPADAPAVEQLVSQLGSPAYFKRRAAARKLMALGERASAALRQAVSHRDLEIRQRARGLLSRLQAREGRRIEDLVKRTGAKG